MSPSAPEIAKDNVRQFDEDVRRTGSYVYTAERLSSRYANGRISECIAECYAFAGKRVFDLGCGDGTYTIEFARLGAAEVLGLDPAQAAIDAAIEKARAAGVADRVRFKVANIYMLDDAVRSGEHDCIVLRGVLHHLPDPERAIQNVAGLAGTVVILEPNGYNPVLKVLEKVSTYHVEHEEQSFAPAMLREWCRRAGFASVSVRYLNLVPMFCPDWMARLGRVIGPVVERIPLARQLSCGQCLIVATR